MSESELTAVYQEQFEHLLNYLRRKFPRLDRSDCEDLAQLAFVETLQKVRNSGFEPEKGWWAWLRWLASNRAIDYLRQHEVSSFEAIAKQPGGSPPGSLQPLDRRMEPPSRVLAEAERRDRQITMLSQILREFCRRCEKHPEMYKQKEVYERALRAQKPTEIAAAMGISRNNVDAHLKRARDWVLNRARQSDVHRSVFLTLHRRKPER